MGTDLSLDASAFRRRPRGALELTLIQSPTEADVRKTSEVFETSEVET